MRRVKFIFGPKLERVCRYSVWLGDKVKISPAFYDGTEMIRGSFDHWRGVIIGVEYPWLERTDDIEMPSYQTKDQAFFRVRWDIATGPAPYHPDYLELA